jgi:hypothetical protein
MIWSKLKYTTVDNFLIINLFQQIKFQVYKCRGCSHDNIINEIGDESAFVLAESGF